MLQGMQEEEHRSPAQSSSPGESFLHKYLPSNAFVPVDGCQWEPAGLLSAELSFSGT